MLLIAEGPRQLAASELVRRHLVDVGLEVQVVPVTADVLRLYHHVSRQPPLHAFPSTASRS